MTETISMFGKTESHERGAHLWTRKEVIFYCERSSQVTERFLQRLLNKHTKNKQLHSTCVNNRIPSLFLGC